jgi:hypothetical protein
MTMRYLTPNLIGLAGLLCLLSQVASCDDKTVEATEATAIYKLYFIRHTEKNPGDDHDPELTAIGQQRADSLAAFLADKNITAIYSTDYKRTRLTAGPTAKQTKLLVTFYEPSRLAVLIKELKQNRQNVLIVGHSNTTPVGVRLAGGQASSIDDDEYGQLFEVIIGFNGVQTEIHLIGP